MTTAAPLHIAGTLLLLDPSGALWWPEQRLLVVSDLHLEKGAAAAARGHLAPPYDTHATLDRLAALQRRYSPHTILMLGDSVHHPHATHLHAAGLARLNHMAASHRLLWILGNHDPALPPELLGERLPHWQHGPLLFRHIAQPAVAPGTAEISGHYHPKARIPARAADITRPCFVADPHRILLPAFGAYTGGLDIRDRSIASLFPRGGRAFLLGKDRLYSFSLGVARLAA